MTRLIASLMMALLILTGQQATSARGTGPAVMEAVLCIGGGLVTVQLDAQGRPTGPTHICPDATLAFLPDPSSTLPTETVKTLGTMLYVVDAEPNAHWSRPHLPPSTGPPLAV